MRKAAPVPEIRGILLRSKWAAGKAVHFDKYKGENGYGRELPTSGK